MVVNGCVKLNITINVTTLETDAVEVDRNGKVKITAPDTFFMDWAEEWNMGNGELLGTSAVNVDLEED